jgi:hypothetical protein
MAQVDKQANVAQQPLRPILLPLGFVGLLLTLVERQIDIEKALGAADNLVGAK